MAETLHSIQLLQASTDKEDESEVRSLVDGNFVRGHPTYIDNLELVYGQKLRTGVYEVTCPRFDTVVVAKSARFAWETPALHAGCTAYQWIESRDICPKLNSILVEEGRVLGFLMENIVDSRHADTEDLEMCQEGPIKAASN